MSGYRHNHYVPVSYQRRFMLPGQTRYFRLGLKPDKATKGATTYYREKIHKWSPKKIFAEADLYTTRWGEYLNTDIEQFFFGRLDNSGSEAVAFLDNFAYDRPNLSKKKFNDFLTYVSLQKLRTPKGLAAFAARTRTNDKNQMLLLLQEMQQMFCATWTDCVWQIADASESKTKFIVSDHPVTVYNRACPHLSQYCKGASDPDIRLVATHTYFPLSLERVLIFTNLSWLRDPYQNELRQHPNAKLFRTAMFNLTDIQVGRKLTEDEVLQINLITKRRAYRYIAAADPEWLYPEQNVSTDHWKKLGGGLLLMPEPRLVHMGGEILIGYEDGSSAAFNEYGHRPWEKDYKDEARHKRETESLERFKAEWAKMRGPKYTAYNHEFGGKLREDSEDMTRIREKVLEKYKNARKKR